MLTISPDTILNEQYRVTEILRDSATSPTLRVVDLKSEQQDHYVVQVRSDSDGPSYSELELEVLRRLEHPNFRRVKSGAPIDGKPGYWMFVVENIAGPDFLQWSAAGKSEDEWIPAIVKILEALGALHDQGYLHCHLSPHCIVMIEDEPKFVYLGELAEECESFDGPIDSESYYAAPELQVAYPLDRRCDLYAIGVMLFKLVTGKLPFGDDIVEANKSKRRGKLPEFPPEFTLHPVVDLIRSLLSPTPLGRPRDARTVARELLTAYGRDASAVVAPKTVTLIPHFIGNQGAKNKLNHAASFVLDGAEIKQDPYDSQVLRRSTRLIRKGVELDTAEVFSWAIVEGASGIGKARFVGEFTFDLNAQGIDVLWLGGRGLHGDTFDPVVHILTKLLQRPGAIKRVQEAPEAIRRELLRLLPHKVTEIPPPASRVEDEWSVSSAEESQGQRDRILDGLAEFMIREALAQPLVLAILDFESLPELAQELIAYVGRRVAVSRRWVKRISSSTLGGEAKVVPLFIVATINGQFEDLKVPADDALQITLKPLTSRSGERLIAAALGAVNTSPEVTELILNATGGKPKRIIDLLTNLNVESRLEVDNGTVKLVGPDSAISRLAPSSGKETDIFKAADQAVLDLIYVFAALKHALDGKTLLRILKSDPSQTLDNLETLRSMQAIRRVHAGRMYLRSPSIGKRVVELIDGERKTELDRLILEELEDAFNIDPSDDRLIALAEHVLATRDIAGIRRYVAEAASCFERIRADSRAINFYRALLDLNAYESPSSELEIRVRLAGCLFRNAHPNQAIETLQKVLEDSKSHWPVVPRSLVGRRLAQFQWSMAKATEALQTINEGLAELSDVKMDEEVAREFSAFLSLRAELLVSESDAIDEAAGCCERAQKILRQHAAKARGREVALIRATLLATQGQIEMLRDNYDSAEMLTRGALAVQERHGAVLQAARCYYRLGSIELARDRDGQAEKYWQKALTLRQEFGDRDGAATVLANLSLSAARLGRLDKAQGIILKSLRIREEIGDERGRAASLHNLGFIYASKGNYQEAVSAFNECLAIRDNLGDYHWAAWALYNLGHALFILGEMKESRQILRSALAVMREFKDEFGEAACLMRLAEIDYLRGRFKKALEKVEYAGRMQEEIGNPEGLCDSYQTIARIEFGLGRRDIAVEKAFAAIEIARKHRLQLRLAKALLVAGRILAHLHKFDSAKARLREAIQLFRQFGDNRSLRCASLEMSKIYMSVGLSSDAYDISGMNFFNQEDELVSSSALGEGHERVNELITHTLLYLVGDTADYARALTLALAAHDICQRTGMLTFQWLTLRLASAACDGLGNEDEALVHAADAQAMIEELAAELPKDRYEEFIRQPVIAQAFDGDPALADMRKQSDRWARSNDQPDVTQKTLGVTISLPTTQKTHEQQRQKPPETLYIKRLSGQETSTTPDHSRSAISVFSKLHDRLFSSSKSDDVIAEVLKAAVSLCGAERGFIAAPGTDGVDVLFGHNIEPEEVRQAQNSFAAKIAYNVLKSEQNLISGDVAHDPELRQQSSVLGVGVRSVLAFPIRNSQRSWVLYLDHRVQKAVFTAQRQQFAKILCDLISMTVALKQVSQPPIQLQKISSLEMESLRFEAEDVFHLEPFHGPSNFMQGLFNCAMDVSQSDQALAILGEDGSGKRTLAKTLHSMGPRQHQPFVIIDVRTIPESLTEPELFGQVEGAFEGAQKRVGLIRSAEAGTIVIDGFWQASGVIQNCLLAAFRQREVRPVGSDEAHEFSARIVLLSEPTTNIEEFRRNSKPVLAALRPRILEISPLRDRPEDLPFAIQGAVDLIAQERHSSSKSISPGAMSRMLEHEWHGNYRELRNFLERAFDKAGGRGQITETDLPAFEDNLSSSEIDVAAIQDLETVTIEAQRQHITKTLNLASDLAEAATLLNVSQKRLEKLLDQFELRTSVKFTK